MMSKREEKSSWWSISPMFLWLAWAIYRYFDSSVNFFHWILDTVEWGGISFIASVVIMIINSHLDAKEKQQSENNSCLLFKKKAVNDNVDMNKILLFPCIYNNKDTNIALPPGSDIWLDCEGKCLDVKEDDITNVKHSCDQHDFTETKRDGVVGRAVIGGIIAGIPGAIIGGATSKSVSTDYHIVINIVVTIEASSLPHPIYVPFADETTAYKFINMLGYKI